MYFRSCKTFRRYPEARLSTEAEYPEVRALALKGAKVFHLEALEFASGAGVPVHIRSVDRSLPGTIVRFGSEASPVTGIASFSDVDFFRLASAQQHPYASGLGIFSDIADANIIEPRYREIPVNGCKDFNLGSCSKSGRARSCSKPR